MAAKSRSYEKRRLKTFWKSKWIPGRDPEVWTQIIKREITDPARYSGYKPGREPRTLMKDCIIKLWLENKITEEQKNNLTSMMDSPDRENTYLAIATLRAITPKHFLRKGEKL